MSEADAVAKCTDGPVTRKWLVRDLRALGVVPGMLLMVHTSMSGLGWVVGGAPTVVDALKEAVGNQGTLVLPTFSSWNADPARWSNPPVPQEWVETIRAEMPPFDPRTAPTREMGAVPEYFRNLPGVVRSNHPSSSWAALGPLAHAVTANQSLDNCQGEESPLARCYDLGGHVLSLGTQRTTILHLAEHRCDFPGKAWEVNGSAIMVDGERRWVERHDLDGYDHDFEALRLAFIDAHPPGHDTWAEGPTGYGTSRLFAIRPLVDFAAGWMAANRRAP